MNISNQLENILEYNQLVALKMLGEFASHINIRAFLVGGSVRDLILGTKLKDIDVCIESEIQIFIDSIQNKDVEIISISQFGTAKIKIRDQIIDLAMTRTEFYPEPAALPNVAFSDINDDIYRRDFTINTLAVSLAADSWGDILDICGGITDIKSRKIRILYPSSFIDDPTRIFRAFRYSARLEFEIEKLTLDSIQLDNIKNLSGVRILNELKYIFTEDNFVTVLKQLDDLGVLKSIDSNLSLSDHLLNVLFDNQLKISSYPDYGILLLAYAITSPKSRTNFSKRLDIPKNIIKAIDDIQHIEKLPVEKYSELYYLLIEVSDLTLKVAKLYETPPVLGQIEIFLNELKHIDLKINGEDLTNRGVSGPKVGTILKKLKTLLLDGKVSDIRSDQISMLERLIQE